MKTEVDEEGNDTPLVEPMFPLANSNSSLDDNNTYQKNSSFGSSKSEENKSQNSKRGPGRPRKDGPIFFWNKVTQKRKNTKMAQSFEPDAFPSISIPDTSDMEYQDERLSHIDEMPLYFETYPGKLCCFCNLDERSALGQGELLRLKAEDRNFDSCSEKKIVGAEGSEVAVPLGCRRQKNSFRSNANERFYELHKVGYSVVTSFQSIRDDAYIYVHRMCAMWSLEINEIQNDTQCNIEPTVERSLACKCSFCGHYGASISCKMTCSKIYHLPCAIASGCFLILQNFEVFCDEHLVFDKDMKIDISCRQCFNFDDIPKLIMCSTCGDHYHTSCIGLVNQPETRSGWNCFQCSKCQICKQQDSSEGRSIRCEHCQKLYHTSCMRPILSSIPKYGWKCNRCRVCTDCNSRTPGAGMSSRWHCHYTICDSCYQQRNKGFSCPVCHRAYRAAAHKEMVKCSFCNRFVHSTCDEDADLIAYHKRKESDPDYDYLCPCCKLMSANHRASLLNDHMRSSNDTSVAGSTSPYPLDVERFSNESDLVSLTEGSGNLMDALKISKKKINFKEISRQRLSKMLMQKVSLISHISRKRVARGKNRPHMLFNNSNLDEIVENSNHVITGEDLAIEKKILLCSVKDKFILSQDICIMCSSVGSAEEGHLIACSQCGQCFHPYCVNVKISKIVLKRGWRCLDCTICEGCGQKNDEARLILCDECDISYHIYCTDPPLDSVPHGIWKCKWCATCQICGSNSPGRNCSWQKGFLECGPCASQNSCCVCDQLYVDGELIIQCKNCERWLHCQCDSIYNEQDAVFCDNNDYQCVLCRTINKSVVHPLALQTYANNFSSKCTFGSGKLKIGIEESSGCETNDFSMEVTHWIDGVCVSERGANIIRLLSADIKKKRKIKFGNESQIKESGISATIESVVAASNTNISNEEKSKSLQSVKASSEECKDNNMWMDSDNSAGQRIPISNTDVLPIRKKRQRNLQKLGIGGFNVRNRVFRRDKESACINKEKICSKESEKKKKIMRRKLKNKLNETYPSYLQEAFFGKELLNLKQPTPQQPLPSTEQHDSTNQLKHFSNEKKEPVSEEIMVKTSADCTLKRTELNIEAQVIEDKKIGATPKNKAVSSSNNIFFDNDSTQTEKIEFEKLLNTYYTDEHPVLDEPFSVDETYEKNNAKTVSTDTLQNSDSITNILSPLEKHAVYEMYPFENNSQQMAYTRINVVSTELCMPQQNQMIGIQKSQLNMQIDETKNADQLQKERSRNTCITNVSITPTKPEECGEYIAGGTQKTAEKMRRDEDLGKFATISAVLYANTQHPELKAVYPNWPERCKQILKKWRSLPTEKKAPFLQLAKDNRSALRMRKSQQDQERISFNQKTLKEQEQERKWKQHQVKAKETSSAGFNNHGCKFGVTMGPDNDLKDVLYYANDPSHKNMNINKSSETRCFTNSDEIDINTSWLPHSTSSSSFPSILSTSQLNLKEPIVKIKNVAKGVSIVQTERTDISKRYLKHPGDVKVVEQSDSTSTSELEKLDADENAGFGDILGGLGDGNDDDLLKSLTSENGDDFNILEYADPELNEPVGNQNVPNKLY